jgi:CheY-like chemotaxis protein
VFLNLLLNAAHAIPDGRADENEITVTTRREGARAIVEIRDSGCGIPSDLLGRIFDPFFTTRKMGEGAGLGLAICQSTVRALGGDITCDSVLGRGSTFRVTLPAADYEPVAGEVAALPAGERRGRILVIDDEPMIGASVRRTLASEHEVIALTAAREALDRIVAGERFDLILCDMMMPVMTGVDLYGELVERAPEQARRVVFFTGGAFTARAQRFLEEVPNPRIEKPFEPAALRSFVRACLA